MALKGLTDIPKHEIKVLGLKSKLSNHDSQLLEILTEGSKPNTETIVTIQRKFTNFNKQLFLKILSKESWLKLKISMMFL